MNKTEREAVEDLLEWTTTLVPGCTDMVNRNKGRHLVQRLRELLALEEKDIYLVVCDNGFARGTFAGTKSMQDLERCARLRNELCACDGIDHMIVRAVQQGTGRSIE